jgi:NADH dehydrogenase [ubiquinone] 1 alpha subcomplex assembly factor 1
MPATSFHGPRTADYLSKTHSMRKKNVIVRTLLLIFFLGGSPLMAEDRVLFAFEGPEATTAWQTVNDGVMGGLSDGRFKINEDKKLEFFGTLSLENNGGFASVRSREAKLGLEKSDPIVIRVRGDGREYNLNLNVPRSIGRNSYRQSFKTKMDEWVEITMPMDKFVATWRGSEFPKEKLDPGNITGMGIQLTDKKAGPFKLEVEWFKVSQLPPQNSDLNSR